MYGNKEETIEQLNEEDLFGINNEWLINIIINKMKNEGNGNALYKLIEEKNISKTFVFQILKYVMNLIPILLENKNKRCAMQTRNQLKNSKNICTDNNKDNVKNKLIRNVDVESKVKKKRGRPRNIIQEIKLQESMKRRGRPRKDVNKSPENNKKRNFIESEDESGTDTGVKQKPKAIKKKKHSKENEDEELEEESYFESNSALSIGDEKEGETQENVQNVEHESENEQLDTQ